MDYEKKHSEDIAMTTEEKAKSYDEALERAKKTLRAAGDVGTNIVTFIFPQLAESEDERNIDTIFNCLYQCCDTGFISGTQRDNALAYLEKQKEQKPAELRNGRQIALMIENGRRSGVIEGLKRVVDNPEEYGLCKSAEWSDEEKDKLNSIERLIVNANAHGNSLIGDKEAIELQHFIRSIVKPITNIAEWSEEDIKKIRSEEYTKGFNDAAFGGKIKEWSVEDEDRIRQIERIAQDAGCTQKLQEEIHDWLKSLRPQIIDSKPLYTIEQVNEKIREAQEWSEEDEKIRQIKKAIEEEL